MAACHVERSETSLISACRGTASKDNLEILREACPERSRRAQNDIYGKVVTQASSPPGTDSPWRSGELKWSEEAETLSLHLRDRRARRDAPYQNKTKCIHIGRAGSPVHAA